MKTRPLLHALSKAAWGKCVISRLSCCSADTACSVCVIDSWQSDEITRWESWIKRRHWANCQSAEVHSKFHDCCIEDLCLICRHAILLSLSMHPVYVSSNHIVRPGKSYLVGNAQWLDGCPPEEWRCHRCAWSVQHGTCHHLLWRQAHRWWCHPSPHWRWHRFFLDPASEKQKMNVRHQT